MVSGACGGVWVGRGREGTALCRRGSVLVGSRLPVTHAVVESENKALFCSTTLDLTTTIPSIHLPSPSQSSLCPLVSQHY